MDGTGTTRMGVLLPFSPLLYFACKTGSSSAAGGVMIRGGDSLDDNEHTRMQPASLYSYITVRFPAPLPTSTNFSPLSSASSEWHWLLDDDMSSLLSDAGLEIPTWNPMEIIKQLCEEEAVAALQSELQEFQKVNKGPENKAVTPVDGVPAPFVESEPTVGESGHNLPPPLPAAVGLPATGGLTGGVTLFDSGCPSSRDAVADESTSSSCGTGLEEAESLAELDDAPINDGDNRGGIAEYLPTGRSATTLERFTDPTKIRSKAQSDASSAFMALAEAASAAAAAAAGTMEGSGHSNSVKEAEPQGIDFEKLQVGRCCLFFPLTRNLLAAFCRLEFLLLRMPSGRGALLTWLVGQVYRQIKGRASLNRSKRCRKRVTLRHVNKTKRLLAQPYQNCPVMGKRNLVNVV